MDQACPQTEGPEIAMHNIASVSSFNVASIGGGSLNCATKSMGDFACDGTVTAHAGRMLRLPDAPAGLGQPA
ncbi:hypothetical protein [Neorhizobium sp. SHOUNA12B]|uniref:hypothetical protein n=2 Tax=unclassified Neorhizobium TaxID=2629175 RepID=UPI0025E5BBD3|nr:hypothetical protein [Neorhizobium sp. SHOUNA12B]MCJ9670657.1 hypothetical protein [Neorhizobium sp. SHOUNA12B]MCJ9743281.1 hypothetical protein [Neorhizobium sp. SHOUNA12A]